ncbi:carbon-nitrogen hydrolase family protein [Kordiimonas marina]|uniref:carbon-nitrogen hydrolase family protein n=1 Tax=Kordiimonas marina TaxID=2872312 RepID=UPI001FF5B5F1|nr:carbon-nitrogen hydrolase family protein [Kordiimonas marina]MCJ9428907.1 carbon-nitrogen hydrolase family protein [Kordiimonas marina]
MRHKKKLITLAVAAAAAFWLFWPGFSPDLSTPPSLKITASASFGSDTGGGNVVGIEPYMVPLDYATPARFKAKLAGYFDAAKTKGWFGEGTVVLLPEHLGTWLIAADSKSRVLEADDLSSAMLPLITAHPLDFLKDYFIFNDQDIVSASLFRTYAKKIADAQLSVFSALAREYHVTIVAGSAAQMTAGIYDDGLTYGHGPIFNASFVFGPDGEPIDDAVRKVHPIPSETGFITPWPQDAGQPTFPLSRHRFGVMICADSWFEGVARPLKNAGADVLLVPAFLQGTTWSSPWRGYLNDSPKDKDWRTDVGRLNEGEAWVKYALPGQAATLGIQNGMTVFLKGDLWGLKGDGRALILEDGTLHVGADTKDGAALYNLWLN